MMLRSTVWLTIGENNMEESVQMGRKKKKYGDDG